MLLEEQVNQIREAEAKVTKDVADLVFSSLLAPGSFATIPEALFSNYFLPFFLGERTDNPNWVLEWVSIAGSPTAPVTVINLNNQPLFDVPPIFNTAALPTNTGSGFSGIRDQTELRRNNIPMEGLKFQMEAFHAKSSELTSQVNVNPVLVTWYNILVRYGKITPVVTPETGNNSQLDDLLEL